MTGDLPVTQPWANFSTQQLTEDLWPATLLQNLTAVLPSMLSIYIYK